MSLRNSALVELQDEAEDTRMLANKSSHEIFYDNDEDLGFRYETYPHKKTASVSFQRRSFLCYAIVVIILALVVGFFVGRSSVNNVQVKPDGNKLWSYDVEIRDAVLNELDPSNIKENLKILTNKPHVAGSNQDEDHLVKFIKTRWESYLDEVKVFPYNVLLSFPNETDKNYVGIIYENNTITDKSSPIEQPENKHEEYPGTISAFNAYSRPGHVKGNMFYVNYGRREDFEVLLNAKVNITGNICIARYGKIFRGDKAKYAEKYQCSALIIYSDPFDYSGMPQHTWNPSSKTSAYPESWWLPPDGIQRGSMSIIGDPLTPDYPSLNLTYRIPENSTDIPKIPVMPISYQDAYKYLSILTGSIAPLDWQGGLNITYTLGGSFSSPHEHCKAIVHVGNYQKQKTVHTVIGYIRGWLEPDRYVLFGGHRDAWTFGGADPNSGTAVVLEVSRAIAKLVRSGKWRPRRTIIFCNWAAEEYGLIGSTEWLEQMEKRILMQAIAYINIDIAVEGNASFRALATPSLYKLLFNVTKSVPNPNYNEARQGRPAVYDTWLNVLRDRDIPSQPFVRNVGSGSDYTFFLQKAGVSSVDLRYTFNNTHLSSYPVYHSLHDTFEYFEEMLDPGFNMSLAIAAIAADSVLQLSGSIRLHLDPTDYVTKLSHMAGSLQNLYGAHLAEHDITLNELNRTIQVFKVSAEKLMAAAMMLNSTTSDMFVRRINDKLFYLDRGFLDFNGLPGRHYLRHIIFAPSSHNSYNGDGFPGVIDAIFEAERGASWEIVKKEMSALCLSILSAAEILSEF